MLNPNVVSSEAAGTDGTYSSRTARLTGSDSTVRSSGSSDENDVDGDVFTLDSPLDGFMFHSTPVCIGLDWEKNGWRVSRQGAPAVHLTRQELLVEDFADADMVIVEQAHMKERNIYSVAQVYTEDELRQLKFRHKLKLFPGTLTAKASRATGLVDADGKPDKTKDAEAIVRYALDNPDKVDSWKPFRMPEDDPARPFHPLRDELRDDMKIALNQVRTKWNAPGISIGEKYELPEIKALCQLLEDNFDELPEGVKEQFKIHRSRNGLRVGRMTAAITIYLAVCTRDGHLRRNPNGTFIGRRFILKSIGMSHSYKPNMARSQLTYHGMRHYKGTRREYMRNLRHLLYFIRDQKIKTEGERIPA